MRKAVVLLLATITIFIFIGAVITQSLLVLQRVAVVSDVHGMVWVKQRGHTEFAPLADRARVAAGDTVKTDANGSLKLSYLDGTRLQIDPGAVVTVLKAQVNTVSHAEASVFKLDLGRVWIRVLKVLSQKSKFDVQTPTATAGVRGTVFSVAVAPDGKTSVSVREGEVALRSSAAGEPTRVGKGQMAVPAAAGAWANQALQGEEDRLWRHNDAIANPNLEVQEPARGARFAPGAAISVEGRAEIGARVTVNGQQVPLRVKGLFTAPVPAPSRPGPFTVSVRAEDARGYVSTVEVPVVVK